MEMNGGAITGSQLACWAGGRLEGEDWVFKGFFQVDSRKVVPGDVFVALQGSISDGHSYLDNAFEKGAVAALVDGRWLSKGKDHSRSYIVLDDVERGLVSLAQKRLSQVQWSLGITGSVGKTTVREMIYSALGSESSAIYRARNSHNTLIGCALTLSEMPLGTNGVILEMGTNHPGEIAQMVELFPIDLAMITKVAPAHLEGLGGLDGVVKAKTEILRSTRLKKALIGGESPLLLDEVVRLSRGKSWSKVSVGDLNSDYKIVSKGVLWSPAPSIFCDVSFSKGNIKLKADILGEHNSLLLALAFAVAVELGENPQTIADRLSAFRSYYGRGQFESKDGVLMIDESYNANPESMMAMLSLVESSPVPVGRRFLVLGEMAELGHESDIYHQKIWNRAKELGNVFLYGDRWSPSVGGHPIWTDLESLADRLKGTLCSGDLLAVKGSRSNGLERLWNLLS